jgi:hypothetical protein
MQIRYLNGSLTKYFQTGSYNASADLTPDANLTALLDTLVSWLGSQLQTGESVADIWLSDGPKAVATTITQTVMVTHPDGTTEQVAEQIPASYRNTVTATVSVIAPQGQRTFSVSSEALPADLRDGLLAAWDQISVLP